MASCCTPAGSRVSGNMPANHDTRLYTEAINKFLLHAGELERVLVELRSSEPGPVSPRRETAEFISRLLAHCAMASGNLSLGEIHLLRAYHRDAYSIAEETDTTRELVKDSPGFLTSVPEFLVAAHRRSEFLAAQTVDCIEHMCHAINRVDRIVESRESTATAAYLDLLRAQVTTGASAAALDSTSAGRNVRHLIGGVDGCRAGWLLLVEDTENGKSISATVLPTSESLFKCIADLKVVTIDIPIGLTEREPRTCDTTARQLLGPRASSVFPAPVRAALAAGDYLDACRLSGAACGKRLSQQAFAILPRIRDVDVLLRQMQAPQSRIREVHPEVCFYFLAQGRPMRFAKKEKEGLEERLALLKPHFPGAFEHIRSGFSRRDVADDDIADALVALWTARRVLRGEARQVPDSPPKDIHGLTMEMVA